VYKKVFKIEDKFINYIDNNLLLEYNEI